MAYRQSILCNQLGVRRYGGEGGIRTLDTISHLHLSPPFEGRAGDLKPAFDAVILAAAARTSIDFVVN
jgi:hypothetical protein